MVKMLFKTILAAIATAELVSAVPVALPELFKRNITYTSGGDKLRGVNIGGWLVLEPWITPSIFQNVDQSLGIVDEFTLCQKLPYGASSILKNHWDNWATYSDFAKIKSAGFNLVRIPIGFWAYDNADTPFVQGAADYLDAAIDWSRQLGLKVIVDLHGAPGSQNGFDNSGQVMDSPRWMEDGGFQGGSSQRTLNIISIISQRYAQSSYDDVILGIELVNEPRGWTDGTSQDDLRKFYAEGFNRVRHSGATSVVMHDAFLHPASYNEFMTPEAPIMDHHYYQVFEDGLLYKTPQQHRQFACESATLYQNADKPVIIGEWTGAMTDCTPHLNGYNKGSRYEVMLYLKTSEEAERKKKKKFRHQEEEEEEEEEEAATVGPTPQIRRVHSSKSKTTVAIGDSSQDRFTNDLLEARENYLQSEAITEDWARAHTKQCYSQRTTRLREKASPDNRKMRGPNPHEIGTKEWMEEFDRRMGLKLPPLQDRPPEQEVPGETYKDWYDREGCKTEWDPLGFCMVEPDIGELAGSE
ncbi:hypothetical protein FKW77_009783 [Venturia effusa]|uniref:Glycoside hydrolase family 5 domain-containing protein n=1 Tax=Venturia effusa TaxID=50376 RepID=A0A517L657_9PEZI|nr:hypothetical protein FKW77_009783 [Venturia effusa]